MDRPQLRRLIVTAYLPSTLLATGLGAILPMIPITARGLGGSFEQAALITALIGIGQLCGDLPAGWLAGRFGERTALIGAACLETLSLLTAWQSSSLWMLALSAFMLGLAQSVVGLARQAYLTEAVSLRWRARALSTLGGVYRIGMFIGPLVSAAIVIAWGTAPAYLFAACMSATAGIITFGLPELESRSKRAGHRPNMWSIVWASRRTLATLGVGAMAVSMVRAARQTLLPLWAIHIDLDPAMTSLLFGLSMGVDMTLFYLGGAVMDRFGRLYVVLPAMIVMGTGMALLPLAHAAWSLGIIAVVLGLGNGISAGIVMTLGSDASPDVGRQEFLGGWRLISDTGNAAGPLMISGVAAIAPLAVACVATGVLAYAGGAWLTRWLPRYHRGVTD